jgi:CHRD domain
VSGKITAADVVGPAGQGIAATEFAEFLAAIKAGATYANVHTTGRTGGEIRGLVR